MRLESLHCKVETLGLPTSPLKRPNSTNPAVAHPAAPVNKPKLREKYGILDEWVLPYKVGCNGRIASEELLLMSRCCRCLVCGAVAIDASQLGTVSFCDDAPHPGKHSVRSQVIPIIDIPGFGTAAAEKVCLDMKIQSQVRGWVEHWQSRVVLRCTASCLGDPARLEQRNTLRRTL